MYCQACGAEASEERRYCNRCGANLRPETPQPSTPSARSVGATWAISAAVAVVTLGGFGMLFSTVMALVSRGRNLTDGGVGLIFAALMVILVVDWLLIRQLPRMTTRADEPKNDAEKPKSRSLKETTVRRLAEPREPVSSVTDHTTRTFEPVRRDRDTQHD